jgi:8-hydroxy-5-deazaflavin:NADPH oxidoreductase
MQIAILGAGSMGRAFARRLVAAGHQVSIASRNAAHAANVAEESGARLAKDNHDAVQGSDAVILATAYADAPQALRDAGPIDGQVIVDITNPLTDDYMGLSIGHTTSAAEEIARSAPGALIVKAFNTLFAQVLSEGSREGSDRAVTVFVAADDARAKRTASAIAQSLGFEVADAGGLKNARYLEPLAGLNVYFGYGAGQGTAISPTWRSA